MKLFLVNEKMSTLDSISIFEISYDNKIKLYETIVRNTRIQNGR